MSNFIRVAQPLDSDERSLLLGWLAFHRNALEAKCHGLTAEQLADRALPPSTLCLLGLVRHLTEMERAYLVWALGPDVPLIWAWATILMTALPGISTPTPRWLLKRWWLGNGKSELRTP